MSRVDPICEEMIKFIGLKELDPLDQQYAHQLATEYYEKISRGFKEPITLFIHIKKHKQAGKGKREEGKRVKYSVHSRVRGPTRAIIESCRAHDWEFARALHKTLRDLKARIKNIYHRDVSGRERHQNL